MNKNALLFKGVRDIVNKYDPVNLIFSGAPEDEYDSEVIRIIKLLSSDEGRLMEEIYEVFVNSFGRETAGDPRIYGLIAKEILVRYSSFFRKK